jgi:hypothetical protein
MKQLAAFILGLFLTSPAWADGTINTLSAGAALTGTEQIPMFQTANPAVTTTPNALKTFVTTSGVVTSITNSDGSLTISPTSGASVASLALGHANTWSGVQSFTNGDLSLLGATSGNTLLEATAVAGAGTIATFPANTGIVAELNLAQTWTAAQTFSVANGIVYSGATTGTQVACLGLDASNNVIKSAAACGSGGGGTPGGTTGNIQYNNAGAFGGFGFTDGSANTAIANTTSTTTAQSFTVYQTWSGGTLPTPTNYSRATFDFTTLANTLTIGTQGAGTGSAQNIQFIVGSRVMDYNITAGATWTFVGPVTANNYNSKTTGVAQYMLPSAGANFYGIQQTSNTTAILGWGGTSNLANASLTWSESAPLLLGASNSVGAWLNWDGEARLDADFSATSNTTLANVTGTTHSLTVNLQAARKYLFHVALLMATGATAGGIKAAFGGTATVTNFIADGACVDSTTEIAVTRISALAQFVANTNAGTTPKCLIDGTFEVNAAGTFTVQFAQNASNAAASTVKRGSFMLVQDAQ